MPQRRRKLNMMKFHESQRDEMFSFKKKGGEIKEKFTICLTLLLRIAILLRKMQMTRILFFPGHYSFYFQKIL